MYTIESEDVTCWDWCCYTRYEYLCYNGKRIAEVTTRGTNDWINFINKQEDEKPK